MDPPPAFGSRDRLDSTGIQVRRRVHAERDDDQG